MPTELIHYESPEQVEDAYYQALEEANFDNMMQLWAECEDIVCVHPMGELLHGRAAVAYSWRQIFKTPGRLKFEVAHTGACTTDNMAVHHAHETIHHGKDYARATLVVVTNIFRLEDSGWRMVAHHASLHPGMETESAAAGRVH